MGSSSEKRTSNNGGILTNEVQTSTNHVESPDINEIYVQEMAKLLSDESEAAKIGTNNLENDTNEI